MDVAGLCFLVSSTKSVTTWPGASGVELVWEFWATTPTSHPSSAAKPSTTNTDN